MTDSPDPGLQFLSNPVVTAGHIFIRLHGRNKGFWYNYLYTDEELEPWAEKVRGMRSKSKVLRIYFNNHYGAASVINALQFKEMVGESLGDSEKQVLTHAEKYYSEHRPANSQQS